MPDDFKDYTPGLDSPANDIIPVTPSDSTDLDPPARSLLVSVSGTIRVTTYAGNVRDIPASLAAAGATVQCRIKRVHATGTTATIYALI